MTLPTRTQLVRKIQPINDLSMVFSSISASAVMRGTLAELMGEPPV